MSRRGGGRQSQPRSSQQVPGVSQPLHRSGGGRGRGDDFGGGDSSRGRGRGRGDDFGGGDSSRGRGQGSGGVGNVGRGRDAFGGSDHGGRGRGEHTAATSTPSHVPASTPQPTVTYPVGPSSSTTPSPSVTRTVSQPTSVETLTTQMEKGLTLASPAPLSSKALRPPDRPGFGAIGQKIMVRANHFLVEVAKRDLYHYDVSITPEITSKEVSRDVMKKLIQLYGESHLGNHKPAYDGRKSLFTAGELPFKSRLFVVHLSENQQPGSSVAARRPREFKVAIKYASGVDLHHLQEFLDGRQRDNPQETIQALDVVLRATPSESYIVAGRSFFSPSLGPKSVIGDGVECCRGYYQSIRPTQLGLSLNIDVTAKTFYEPIAVTDFIGKHLNINFSQPLSDKDRVKVKKALKGVKVELKHSGFIRTYKVSGVTKEPMRHAMFSLDDGRKLSVVQYFLERYNIVLKHVNLPALLAGSEAKPVFLPFELSTIAPRQRYSQRLNENQVRNFLKATCHRPSDRQRYIEEIVTVNDFNGDERVRNEFGIQLNEDMTMVNARVLPAPMLRYHDSGKEKAVDPKMGQWNMINKRMRNGGKVEYWTCVSFSTRVLRSDMVFVFCEELINMCASKGMDFNRKPFIPISTRNPHQIDVALKDIHRQSMSKLQLLIIILPDLTGSYGKIKRICETELGIITQCCRPQQASKLQKNYFENVSLKINVKVGGQNSVLNDALLRRIPLVSDVPTIIFGADVTHPQPGEDSSASIAAVVASMDWPEITKYKALISAQGHRDEIIHDLYKSYEDPQKGTVHVGMIRELLISFFRSSHVKPKRIIFYRDGVSEGQFSQVLLHEVDAIRKACGSLEPNYQPPITFVVVQKRHHTRLFPLDHSNRNQTDRSGNILPGTVVDTKICHPTEFDFYLNSHAGIQGTSRPTHYHVLFDENNFNADQLQLLTYNLTYTYVRCTRSVSIVPPAYYAHLAAFRARYYMESESSEVGSTSESRGGGMQAQSLPTIMVNVKEVMFYC